MHRIPHIISSARIAAFALTSVVATGTLAPAVSAAREVAHVEVPERVEVAGKALRLNGAGLRTKFFFEVYVAALYVPAASDDAAEILGADAPWELTMTFRRDVARRKVLEGFTEAFEHNSPGEFARLQPELARLGEVLHDLSTGQRLVVCYVPGQGTTFGVEGGPSVTVAGRAFAVAMLKTWIGDFPSDPSLKDALLGR